MDTRHTADEEPMPASPDTDLVLRVAQVVSTTEAEGPGRRFALWFQGCPLRCPGCCNPEMLPFDGGHDVPVIEIVQLVFDAAERDGVEGITLLGGEPLAHAAAGAELAKLVHQRGLSLMVF